ncbi:MAG: class II aldolase/adducin family protein, partial [Syntrophothermus sp.]
MKRTKIIEEIAQVSRHLWEKGWAERNAGNISVNITAHLEGIEPEVFGDIPVEPLSIPRPLLKNNIFIITPTGSRMRELTRNTMDQLCYLRINDDGTGILN